MYKEWRPTDFIIECIIRHMLLVTCEQHKRAGLLQGRVPAQKVDGLEVLLIQAVKLECCIKTT